MRCIRAFCLRLRMIRCTGIFSPDHRLARAARHRIRMKPIDNMPALCECNRYPLPRPHVKRRGTGRRHITWRCDCREQIANASNCEQRYVYRFRCHSQRTIISSTCGNLKIVSSVSAREVYKINIVRLCACVQALFTRSLWNHMVKWYRSGYSMLYGWVVRCRTRSSKSLKNTISWLFSVLFPFRCLHSTRLYFFV
jgi:hypothetical protein